MSKTLRVKYHLSVGYANAKHEEVVELELDDIKKYYDCLGMSDADFELEHQEDIEKFINEDYEVWTQNYLDNAWWFLDDDED